PTTTSRSDERTASVSRRAHGGQAEGVADAHSTRPADARQRGARVRPAWLARAAGARDPARRPVYLWPRYLRLAREAPEVERLADARHHGRRRYPALVAVVADCERWHRHRHRLARARRRRGRRCGESRDPRAPARPAPGYPTKSHRWWGPALPLHRRDR